MSGLVKAIEWVVQRCGGATAKCIINVSGGGGASNVLDLIANDAVRTGNVAFVGAAGNYVSSCLFSPGRAADVVGVGATEVAPAGGSVRGSVGSMDEPIPVFADDFSATGPCIDVLAPGSPRPPSPPRGTCR